MKNLRDERGDQKMPKTIVRENDTLDEALKRFKRDVSRSGTLVEARKRQHYMKPSDVRKEKRRAALPLLSLRRLPQARNGM